MFNPAHLKDHTHNHKGLKLCFLSDFRPREEYYVLLDDESSTIKRFGKMLKSSIRICFFYESVRSKFSFFSFSISFAIFLDSFEEKAPRHQKK